MQNDHGTTATQVGLAQFEGSLVCFGYRNDYGESQPASFLIGQP
jgi:hypothetical protein